MTEPSVNDISDSELIKRALYALRHRRPLRRPRRLLVPLWSNVMDVFALGSTYSQQLCRRFGLDPEEMVRP